MRTKANDQQTFRGLKNWMVAKDELQQEYGGNGFLLAEAQLSHPKTGEITPDVLAQMTPSEICALVKRRLGGEEDEEEPEEEDELTPEVIAQMSPSEICAVMNKRAARGGWQQ